MSQAYSGNTPNLSRRAALAEISLTAAAAASAGVTFPLGMTRGEITKDLTVEQLAALKFEPIAEFIDFEAARPNIQESLNRLYTMGSVAIGLLGKTKAELREFVRNLDANSDPSDATGFHELITDAREYAEGLVQFLTAAEIRFAVALASEEQCEGAGASVVPDACTKTVQAVGEAVR
jgi:hypothetical protein